MFRAFLVLCCLRFCYSFAMTPNPDPKLLEQIAKYRAWEMPKAQLRIHLMREGWAEGGVDAALSAAGYPDQFPLPAPWDPPSSQVLKPEHQAAVLIAAEGAEEARYRDRREKTLQGLAYVFTPIALGARYAASLLTGSGLFAAAFGAIFILVVFGRVPNLPWFADEVSWVLLVMVLSTWLWSRSRH